MERFFKWQRGEAIYYSVLTVLKTFIACIVKKYIILPFVVIGVDRFYEFKNMCVLCPFIIFDKRLFYLRVNFGFKVFYCRTFYFCILTVGSQFPVDCVGPTMAVFGPHCSIVCSYLNIIQSFFNLYTVHFSCIYTISHQMHCSDSLLLSCSYYMFRHMYVIITELSFMCPAELH
jgi:hypothetical protein